MKRVDLMRHLMQEGCFVLREGAKHTVIIRPTHKLSSTVPRHREINDFLARKICHDLGIREFNR